MDSTEEHKYSVSFDVEVHEEGITSEELEDTGYGAADALLAIAVMGEEGSPAYQLLPYGFRVGNPENEMSHDEIFRIVTLILCKLADSDQISADKREFSRAIKSSFEMAVKQHIERPADE